MKEDLLVKGLDGQIKILALVFTGDKYKKGKSTPMVVRGLNTKRRILGNH